MNGKSRKSGARSKVDKIGLCTALFDRSRDGILIVSPSLQFMDVNPSGMTMLGYTDDEISKLFLPDTIHPEDNALIDLLELEAGRHLTIKCRLRHKNGKYVLLALEVSKLPDGNFLVIFNRISRPQPKQEQANQQNLEEIVNRSPAIVFLWRAAAGWPVEYVSDNIRQFGYTPRDFYKGDVTFAAIVHPDDLERVVAEVGEYSQKGYTEFTQEYRILTVDKEIRWVDDHTWVKRDERGHILNYQGIVLDITDRKQMEDALRESEEKFRSIVENSLAGIFIVDDSYRFVYANDELCRILGYPKDELTGLDFRKVLSEDSLALVTDRYIRRQRGEQVPSHYELKVLRRDGEVREAEMIVTVVKDAFGKPRTTGQLVDITERKRLEQETKERRLFLESVLVAAPDAIVISDTRHLISEWNPGAERLFGYSSEEVIGQSVDKLITGTDAEIFEEATNWTRQVQDWQGIKSAETVRYRKDGSPVNVIVSVAPILVGKNWVGVVAIYTDITERKQAEMARQESEHKFRAVVQNAQAVIFILDMNGVFLLSEGQALAKLGLAPGQMVGASVYQVYRENRSVLDGITKALAGELTRFTTVEQGIVFDTVCSPYYNLEGKLTGVIGIAIDITDRQRAEETLQLFQYTTDRARDAVQWLTREGGFEYVNEQACRSLGYTREELLRLHLWDIDPIYPRERWDENWESYQPNRQGGSESIETLHRRKDGSVFPVEVVSNHLWFGDRELHVAVVRDITERKQAEEALRESEQKFRSFIEQSSDGLVLSDEQGIIIEWNQAQESLTGLTRQEIIGQSLWDVQLSMMSASAKSPETRQRLKMMITSALQSGQADFIDQLMEISISHRNGTKVIVQQMAFLIKTNRGYRLGSISRDITKLKQAEQELKASEEKYRRLVEVSPLPMWINKDGIITYMNPAALQVLGATDLDQVVGKTVLDFIHPDYHSMVEEHVSHMMDDKMIVTALKEKYIRLDGNIIDVEVTATLFPSSADSHVGQVFFQDITERKRAEAEREKLIRELTDKNSELERFTYTVSHDLKSPLITIAGFLGYLEKDAASGDMNRLRSDIQRIQNAVDKMDRLLNELLELSRIGRLMNPPAEVSFEDITREALGNVHGQLEARGVAVELAPNLPAVYGDRQRLVEVLQNLIDNAIKFMGDQPNPCIEIGRRDEENGNPIFFVKDNGIGIAPEYTQRIFGLFDKLDSKTEGTGIGLAIVKRIVEFHGGRIWVESEVGKGSTFCFTLSKGETNV